MRCLVLTLLLICTASADAFAKRVALVLGNGAYAHATPLPNPTRDAAAMSRALTQLGFEVVEGRDLDRSGTLALLSEFANQLQGADAGLLFYAGHGIQVAGVNYIVPVDAALARESDVFLSLVSLDDVLRVMETEVPTRLVFLDACRDNPLARSLKRSMSPTRSASVGQGLARVDTAAGTLIAYSTAPGDVAEDGEGQNSPFTKALLDHIATPGLEARQVLTRVRNDVQLATSGRQLPWDSSSLTGDFYFNLDVTVNAPQASPAPSTFDDRQAELLFWESIKDSDDPGDFQAYLEAFGDDGLFAALAKSRAVGPEPQAPASLGDATPDQEVSRGDATPDFKPSRNQWRQIQSALNALGFNAGAPDGRPGPRTMAALGAWRTSQNLTAQGGLDETLLETLLSSAPAPRQASAGQIIQDCPDCPKMVVIGPGKTQIGANPGDPGYEDDEFPRQEVRVGRAFAIAQFEVTRAEFARFLQATGHRAQQGCYDWAIIFYFNADRDWQDNQRSTEADHPVVCVSKLDAKAYASWMSERTGKRYRLPSEAEFVLAAAGGRDDSYAWPGGLTAACQHANVYDSIGEDQLPLVPWSAIDCSDGVGFAARVGSFKPNGFGLYDMIGNAMEYVEDCWFGNLDGHPGDGRAWIEGGDCDQTVIKGGSWWPPQTAYQLADRWNVPTRNGGFDSQGFRLVRELD